MALKKLVPINNSLEKLVWGSGEPVTVLLEQGKLPDGWSESYCDLVKVAEDCLFTSRRWSQRLFLSLHFTSCYLPLRYEVWIAAGNRPSLQTQQELGEISRSTEILFWNTLLRHHCFTQCENFTGNQRALFALSFGDRCPLEFSGDPQALKDWKADLKKCLTDLEREYCAVVDWPAWILIAVHFISFYVDLSLQRQIGQRLNGQSELQSQSDIDDLCSRLSEQVPHQSLIQLIRLWLESSHCRRDSSGLPLVKSLSQQVATTISPRTNCEVLLFQSNPSEC